MSSKQKNNNVNKGLQANTGQVEPRVACERNAAREEKIRLRAYEIYLERGEQPGSELGDWCQAERELEGEALAQAS
jgi:Protein of unknown function (DUF2934)